MNDALKSQLVLTMLPGEDDQTVYTGFGPDLTGANRYPWVVVRHQSDAPEIVSGRNLIENPGFEDNTPGMMPTGWNVFPGGLGAASIRVQRDNAATGIASLALFDDSPTLGVGAVSRPIPIAAGNTYRAQVQARAEGGGVAMFYMDFRNAANERINAVSTQTAAGDWQTLELEAVAPEGTTHVMIILYSSTLATGTVHFDDVVLQAVTLNDTADALRSRFAAVIQVVQNDRPAVARTTELPLSAGGDASLAVRLDLDAGLPNAVDYVLSNARAGHALHTYDGTTELATNGIAALVRLRQGEMDGLRLLGGTDLKVDRWELFLPQASLSGQIESVDYNDARLVTRTRLPVGTVLAGTTVTISSPHYARNTAYEIDSVEALPDGRFAIRLTERTLELNRNQLERSDANALTFKAPVHTDYNYGIYTTTLDGKLIVNRQTGATTRIGALIGTHSVRADGTVVSFSPGNDVVIYDVAAGDTFEILHQVTLQRDDSGGAYTLHSTGSVAVTSPVGSAYYAAGEWTIPAGDL